VALVHETSSKPEPARQLPKAVHWVRSSRWRGLLAAAVCATSLACEPVAEPSGAPPAPGDSRAAPPTAPTAQYAFPFRDPSRSPQERATDLVRRLTLNEKLAQLVHETPAIKRLGVPAYNWWNEALHGVARHGRATVFPQAIGLAATFDEALLQQVATIIADEARAKFNAARRLGNQGRYAGLTFWSPNINIFRDPRWGRGQETYGEDPFLTSRLGVAFVRGLQGSHPKLLKTAACAKHFAVHSGPEALRHQFDAWPSKQDLYESYLPAFEALVTEARVECVMSAYNRVYGEPASASPLLLQQILRQAWSFPGYVVSDCWALADFKDHHRVTRTSAESAALALGAGVNLDCGNTYPRLRQALAGGLVTEAQIDQALRTLFKTRFRLGLFDPSTPFDSLRPEIVGSDKHARVARRAATASLVLLKNANHTLPLSKRIKRLSLLGPYGADGYVLLGNYFGHSARLITLVEGIAGKIDAGTTFEFRHAFLADRASPNPVDWTVGAAHKSDAILVTLGMSGLLEGEEGAARASPHHGDRQDLSLPDSQLAYLKKLRAGGDTPIISVVFGGSALALEPVAAWSDAVLLVWYPGQEGGAAIADVLFGDVAPSGRLPLTFPKSVEQLPPFTDYSMDNRGYRFAKSPPLYPFGFGLSYGKVVYEKLELSSAAIAAGDAIGATVTVRNRSAVRLEEVVQLYLTDLDASVRVPRAALVGFRRVPLAPGRVQLVQFEVPASAMRVVTETGERRIEPGTFRLTAGGASPTPRAQELGSPKSVTARFVVR
jgi:beta-glucosidase